MAWPPVKTWKTEVNPLGPPADPVTATPFSGEALTAEFQAARDYIETWSAQGLKRTAVKTGPYTLAVGQLVPVDASGGTVALTLPSAPADGSRFAFKIILQAATPNAVTLATGGADVFNKAAGSTSLSYAALNTAVTVQYDAATHVYSVTSTDSPLNVASGAAKTGTDNKVGGPGGTALADSVVTTSPGSSLAEGLGAGIFKNAEPQWYGPWWTIGNAAGSNGGARTPASAPATTVGSGGVTLPLTNGTVPISDCAQLSANGGSFTLGGFTIAYTGRSASSGAGNATGCYTLSSATGTYAAGTALGFVGIGWGPLSVYQKFGDVGGGSNHPIPGTTQAGYFVASYYGPTVDDSMEALSGAALAKDTGTAYTQTKAISAIEGDAQIEGANTSSGGMIGVSGRITATGTSHVTSASAVYAGLNAKDAGATIDNYYAFRQAGVGHGTNNWGLYALDLIESETGLRVQKSSDASMDFRVVQAGSGGGSPAFIYARNPAGTDFATLRLDAITGQNQPLVECFVFGGSAPAMTVAKDGTITTIAGMLVKASGGATRAGFDNNGNGMIQSATTITDGAVSNSPYLQLQAAYDSDPSGAVSSTAYNFRLRHKMVTAGASPASSLSIYNNADSEVWSVDQTGAVSAVSMVASGAVSAASLTATGTVAGATVTSSGDVTATTGMTLAGVSLQAAPNAMASAMGFLSWSYDPAMVSANTAPTSGTIYAVALPLLKGQVVANVVWDLTTPGAGTPPTNIYVALANATTVVKVSNDLASSGIWTGSARFAVAPLSASYTVPSSGLYYALILQNGSWGSTQMVLGRAAGPVNAPGSIQFQATGGTAQTSISLGAITLSQAGTPLRYFAAAS